MGSHNRSSPVIIFKKALLVLKSHQAFIYLLEGSYTGSPFTFFCQMISVSRSLNPPVTEELKIPAREPNYPVLVALLHAIIRSSSSSVALVSLRLSFIVPGAPLYGNMISGLQGSIHVCVMKTHGAACSYSFRFIVRSLRK